MGGLRCFRAVGNVNVYIDGFNLYYGCLQGSPYRWLDVLALSRATLPNDSINRIRYFTARINTRPGDTRSNAHKRLRQQLYLRAIETIPGLCVHYGHYLAKTKRRPLVHPQSGWPRTAEFYDSEEKGSDVNLATYLLVDAFDQDGDASVIISNDSDLVFPVEVVRRKFGRVVGILNPHRVPSAALRKAASFFRQIHPSDLQSSLFPSTLSDANGTFSKPASW